MRSTPRILSLATAVPPHVFETEMVRREARKIFSHSAELYDRLSPVFANSGIERRYSVCEPAWFFEQRGWPERTEQFLRGAKDLFRMAASRALEEADIPASRIDAIVTVSSTGIATPSIEAHMLAEMGFRTDVRRTPVFGLGCAGGLSGLSLAAQLAKANQGQKILLVVIEICSLAFRMDEMTKSNIVATAIFGDGAAAAVLCAGAEGFASIEHAGEHTWPKTLDVMGWRVDPQGFGAIFSRSIPDLALRDLRPAADEFLNRHELALADVDQFSFHPGGAKVITALEQAFTLDDGTLQAERKILKDFGNMSAPTVLFVLNATLRKKQPGRRFLGALGPGFTASFLTMLPQ